MKKVLKWVAIVFGGLILIGILFGDSEPTTSTSTATTPTSEEAADQEPERPDLEVLDFDSERDEFGTLYITGTIQNNTNRNYSYVQVEINLYDDSDAQLGSTLANTNNLEPGGRWKFRAAALQDGATKYRIVDVTGF